MAVKSVDELQSMLQVMHSEAISKSQSTPVIPKSLRCQSHRTFCPASFETVVCRAEDLFTFYPLIESWSFKRHFRLYKPDKRSRWDDNAEGKYCGILFNYLPVIRPSHIELEALMDRELVSRLIAGMCVEINAPLTFFALNTFNLEEGTEKCTSCWMPIEGYSKEQRLVPPRFCSFCETCRDIGVGKLRQALEKENNIASCPHLRGGKCGRHEGKPACKRSPRNYNHCPLFCAWRKDKDPCYNSDVALINRVTEKWRRRATFRSGVSHSCHAGLCELAFPIEVHGHLLAVAMIGQLFFGSKQVKEGSEFVNSKKVVDVRGLQWDVLLGEENRLDRARQILVGDQLKRQASGEETVFLVTREQVRERIERLLPNLERFRESAECHYRDFRGKLESAFRCELMGLIENHRREPDFLDRHIPHILQRMQQFWAFEGVYLLRYSFTTNILYKIAQSIHSKVKSYGINGKQMAQPYVEEKEMHSCPYLHYVGEAPRKGTDLNGFLNVCEDIVKKSKLELAKGDCEFIVLTRSFREVYIFVLAGREPETVSSLESSNPGGISDICQDAIFETCSEIMDKLHTIKALYERHLDALSQATKDSQKRTEEEATSLAIKIETLSTQIKQLPTEVADELQSGLSDIEDAVGRIFKEVKSQPQTQAGL